MIPKLNKYTYKINLAASKVLNKILRYCKTARHRNDAESCLLHRKNMDEMISQG